ncbi:hypothetical protein ACLMAJ_31390 [Nocardia sp. KC 131]|uniref:hypothetical protein n=1 Tax=Nocardia arseniciresistens TaxID=3392119 RepID=UPI00398F2593
MGSDDDEDATPQQIYDGQLFHLQHHGTSEQATNFAADGPPPPMATDGITGKILWFEEHPPSMEEFARLLELMETGGWITTAERQPLTELPLCEGLAELKACMIERDTPWRQTPSGTE